MPSVQQFAPFFLKPTRVSMEVSNQLVSWVITYLRDLQPTYIGVIIQFLSTMDIPVSPIFFISFIMGVNWLELDSEE